jgi:hypothetical protein
MIWIFRDNKNQVFDTLEDAKEAILSLCGDAVGKEAIDALTGGSIGTFFRKGDSPLIKIVSRETGNYIRLRERLGKKKPDGCVKED